jgi:hypothetical protein
VDSGVQASSSSSSSSFMKTSLCMDSTEWKDNVQIAVLNTNVVSFQIVFWKNSHFNHQKSQKKKKKKKKNGGKTKKE